ncbi:unnamed protein product [Phytophthora lilii]|uniref:Unnamed protein product n=1 Tax=Phytophthora lilii TaxID=2077276 RepID=A0A9W6U800_9STRA|nr:unnamed protein product [Phytophthora lilii]
MGFGQGKMLSWKHLLLGMILLSNLLYVWMIILRSPDTLKTHFNAVMADRESSVTAYGEGIKAPTSESTTMLLDGAGVTSNSSSVRHLKCIGWRATNGCSPNGSRRPEKDQDCKSTIPYGSSGYCEVIDENSHETFRVMKRTCSRGKGGAIFTCADAPEFFNFRFKAQNAVDAYLVGVSDSSDTKQNPHQGIAMVVYPKLIASAYATIRTLRDVLNCQLPIEIWFRPDEMSQSSIGLDALKSLIRNETARDLTFHEIDHPEAFRFNAKIYGIRHSSFDQVLFLDADNVPVRDPSYLIKTTEFTKTGARFWPDYWHPDHTIFFINAKSLVWELLGTPFVDMFEQESGQILIDRRRHAAPLTLAVFYAFHRPSFFDRLKLAWGDKDLFRFAWLKLGAEFHMIQRPPSVAGKMFGNSFCGMTMVQHDSNGEVLFLHRNQLKLTGQPSTDDPKELHEMSTRADELLDPEMWTHLMSFRNTSARAQYVIQANSDRRFSKHRRCFGRRFPDRSQHFYTREFSSLPYAGHETHLRQFAMEAVLRGDKKRGTA